MKAKTKKITISFSESELAQIVIAAENERLRIDLYMKLAAIERAFKDKYEYKPLKNLAK